MGEDWLVLGYIDRGMTEGCARIYAARERRFESIEERARKLVGALSLARLDPRTEALMHALADALEADEREHGAGS